VMWKNQNRSLFIQIFEIIQHLNIATSIYLDNTVSKYLNSHFKIV
jgi:hypothetical protein